MNDEKWVLIIECEFRPRCASGSRHGNGRENAKERLRLISGEVLVARAKVTMLATARMQRECARDLITIRRMFAFFHEQSFVYPAECERKHRSDGNMKSLYYMSAKIGCLDFCQNQTQTSNAGDSALHPDRLKPRRDFKPSQYKPH